MASVSRRAGGSKRLQEHLKQRLAGAPPRFRFEEVASTLSAVRSSGGDAKPLLVYVHVPFCSSKCTFCTWVAGVPVHQLLTGVRVRRMYVDALSEQIERYAPRLASLGYEARYVYWGGGTPTMLEADEIRRLGRVLQDAFGLASLAEYTAESSPETLTPEKLRAMRDVGIRRLSIGVQSFDERELRRAGRAHTALQAELGVTLARQAGFDNINLDVIAAFPEQTEEVLERTLTRCVALAPEHVTVYDYREAAGTVMAKQLGEGKRVRVDRARRGRLTSLARELLETAGYHEYQRGYFASTSNTVFQGELYYFKFQGDFFGFGSGAHSVIAQHLLLNRRGALPVFLADPSGFDRCERFDPLDPSQRAFFANRQIASGGKFDPALFRERFGFDHVDLPDLFSGSRSSATG